MRFENKVAIVTAAANGIGKATAKILAREGAQLVAVDINPDALSELTTDIEKDGGNITPLETNVLEDDQVQELVDSVVGRFNKIDILVNAVGGSSIIPNSRASVDDLSLNDWENLVDLWKNKIKKTNDNLDLTSHQLDHVLEQYYLKTETPTMEYVHSLCALASQTPLDLQPILECTNLEQLLERTTKLLESDINPE